MSTPRPNTPGRVKAEADKLAPGRKRKEPPANAAEVITNACATGASRRGVQAALGVSSDLFDRWMAEYPALKEAFALGREKERQTLHNVLFDAATKDGNIVAAMFLLKARHGYREGDQGDQAGRLNVTFNIPAALPLDKFVIENGSTPIQQLSAAPSRLTGRT